jgi:TP901 family phage tail tape measure protein
MAGPFNITAALQLQAPTNLQAVVGDIQRKLSNITATVNIQVNSGSIGTLSQLNQQLQALQTNLAAVQAQASASTNAVNRISSAYQQAGSQANSSAAQVAASNQALQAQTLVVEQSATAMENFGRQAGLAARRYSAFLLAGGAIVGFANEIRNAVGSALSFERELIKLVQSGDDASTTVKSLEADITRLATSWGVSSKALLDTTVQLRLAGLTMQETKIAMEALAKASLAPDFGTMTETAEGFLAIMNQFKVSAKEAADALGSVNAVSVQYAVTSRDIIDAVVRAGGAFRTIGGNLNELIAIFTSIRSTTRESAESIGTALRTILVRMERPQVLENLRQLGVELRRTREEAIHLGDANLEGQFVGPYEAIRRLSQALQGLRTTDIRFAGIAEELGGYRQISKTIPALQEFAKAQQIYQVAQAGTNSLTSAAEQAQAAFLVRLTKVREEFQALIRTVTESKGFQVFLDIVIQLTHGLNQLASVLTPLIPLIAALGVFKLGSGIANFGKGLAGGFINSQAPRFASGGVVPGQGDSDSVYAQLTPGEYVIRKQAAQKIGYDRLHHMNRYAQGGMVEPPGGKVGLFFFDPGESGFKNVVTNVSQLSSTSQATVKEQGGLGQVNLRDIRKTVVNQVTASGLKGEDARAAVSQRMEEIYKKTNDASKVHTVSVPVLMQQAGVSPKVATEFDEDIVNVVINLAKKLGGKNLRGEAKSLAGNLLHQNVRGRLFDNAVQVAAKNYQVDSKTAAFDLTPGINRKDSAVDNLFSNPGIWADVKIANTKNAQESLVGKAVRTFGLRYLDPGTSNITDINKFDPKTLSDIQDLRPVKKAMGGVVRLAEGGDPYERFYIGPPLMDLSERARERLQQDDPEKYRAMVAAEAPRRLTATATQLRASRARTESGKPPTITAYEGTGSEAAAGEFVLSGASYRGQVKDRAAARQKFTAAMLETGLGGVKDGTLRVPYTNDKLGIISMDDASFAGRNIVIGSALGSLRELNPGIRESLQYRSKVNKVQGIVDRYVLSAHANQTFENEISKEVVSSISNVFKSKFQDPGHNFQLDPAQVKGINGYLLEQYVAGVGQKIPAGGTSYFDFVGTANQFKGKPIEQLVYPRPLRANLLESKYSAQGAQGYTILSKYLNFMRGVVNDEHLSPLTEQEIEQFGVPKKSRLAKGGHVDSVPSLLTPGEFVINANAAQRIGYANLDRMNRTGVAHFAQGGEVRHYEGGSPGGVAPSVLGGTVQGEFTRQEALAMAQSMNIAGAEIGRMLLQFRQLGIGINSLDKAIISFTEGLEARVLGRRTPIVTDYSRPGFTPQPTVGVQPVTVQPVPVYPAVDPRRDRLANQLEGAPGIPVQARPVYPAVNPKKDFLAEEFDPTSPRYRPILGDATTRTPVYGFGLSAQSDLSDRFKGNVEKQLQARGGREYVSRQTQQEVKIAELNKIYDQLIKEETDRLKSAGKVKSATEQQRIATEKVAATLSRVQEVQEAGGLEAVRANASVTPPTTLRARIGGFVSNNLRGIATGIGTLGAFYAAQGLEHLGGTAEQAAQSGSSTGYVSAQSGSGFIQGTATGALVGSAILPGWGTAIGALVGGLGGLTTSFNNASTEFNKATAAIAQSQATKGLQESIRLNRGTTPQDLQRIQNAIGAINTANPVEQGLFTRLTRSPRRIAELEEEGRRNRERATEPFRREIEPAFIQEVQNMARRGRNISPEGIQARFGTNRLTSIFGEDTDAVIRRLSIIGQGARSEQQGERGRSQAAQVVQNFEALALSLRNATTGLDTFNRAMTVSAALAQGQIGGGANRNIATDLNQLGSPNSTPFRESVTRIGGLFGGRGNTFTQQGLALDETQRVLLSSLPTLISRLSGRVGARDPQSELKDIVRRNVGDDNLRANPFLGRALNVAVSQLGAIQPGQLSQQLATDPEGLINRLLEPLRGPLLRHGEEIGRRAQEIANSFDQAATRFNQELQRAGQAWDQAVKLSVGAIRTEAENRVQSGQGLALFNTPLATLEEGFNAPQRRLAASGGLRGAAAFDPNAIGARLSQVNAQARATYEQRETLTPGTNEYNNTNARFRELQRSSSDLQQALQHLTQVGERNAAIEERLGTLRRDEETRMSIAERFLTGGPREQLELMQQQQLVSAAAQQGNLRGFSNLDMSQIFKFLGANPNLIIGNNTGAGLRQQFLQDPFINQQLAPFLGFAGNVNTNRGQINALSGERVANAQAGAQAQGILAEGIQGNAVQDMNEAFRATAEVSNQLELSLRAFDARVQETVAIMAQASALNLPANPQGRAAGGTIFAARGSDTVPAMLTPGEYVVNRDSAQANLALLHRMNRTHGAIYMQQGGRVSVEERNRQLQREHEALDPPGEDNTYMRSRQRDRQRGATQSANQRAAEQDAGIMRRLYERRARAAAARAQQQPAEEQPIIPRPEIVPPHVAAARRAAARANEGHVPAVAQEQVAAQQQARQNAAIAGQRTANVDPNSFEAIQGVANAFGQQGNLIGGAQAAIAYTQARMGLEFSRASSAAAFGAGLSRLNIGQRAPGLAEQFNYTATARQRLGNLGLQNSAFGITADAALGARGTYGRLQLAGGYGTPDVPTTTQQDWIVNRGGLGVVVGKYTGPDALRGHPDWRVRRFAGGGYVTGGGVTDSIPSLLTAGEFVLNANATRNIGPSTLQHFNDGGQVNTPPSPATASPNVGASFTEDVGRLQSVFNSFASSIANLGNIISKIPPSIQLTANHNVNMNINGAEAFAGMEEKFTELVVRHAEAAINNLIEKRFPDAGKLDASERTPLAQEV